LLGGRISFGVGLHHGWKPLGKPHIVSAVSGNIIYKIDGEPAIRLYEDYLAYDVHRIKKDLQSLSILYPLGIRIAGQDRYLLRNVQAINTDGSLVCRGDVPEGSTVRFMISTKETCLEATRSAVEDAKAGITAHGPKFHKEKTSRVVIVFNSLRRAALLGKDILNEVNIIYDALEPDAGIIGVNSFAELAPLSMQNYNSQTYFQNQMISIIIIEG